MEHEDEISAMVIQRMKDLNASNYVRTTNNILVSKADLNDLNTSNYVRATSNLISKRSSSNTITDFS